MSFSLLTWLVAAVGVAIAGMALWAGHLWRADVPRPDGSMWRLAPRERCRKAAGGLTMALGLFVALGALTLMKPQPKVTWIKSLESARALAEERGRPIMIDFWASWCTRCKEIEAQSFGRPEFLDAVAGYVPLKIDTTDDETPLDRFDVRDLPAIVLTNHDLSRRRYLDPDILGEGDATAIIVREMRGFAAGTTPEKTTSEGTFGAALERGLLWALLSAFVGGLVVAFTPCVLPFYMLALPLIFEPDERRQAGPLRTIGRSMLLVVGLALSYTTLGLTAALTGGRFAALFQQPAFLVIVAAVFATFGLHLLELPKLRVFDYFQRASRARDRLRGPLFALGSGVLLGLVAAPCVGPILFGVLTYIASTGNAALGSVFMFIFALGMGLPFVVIASFGGVRARVRGLQQKANERAETQGGAWPVGIQSALGATLIAGALYLLVPVFPSLGAIFDHLAKLAP